MKIQSIDTKVFRRFSSLRVSGIPANAKLVVLVGPNGSGKSAVFDAINTWYLRHSSHGHTNDPLYFVKGLTRHDAKNASNRHMTDVPEVTLHGQPYIEGQQLPADVIRVRSAHRHQEDFTSNSREPYTRKNQPPLNRLIDQDTKVSTNYNELVATGIETLFADEPRQISIPDLQKELVYGLRSSVTRIFPDLELSSLGKPFVDGSFYFSKGSSKGFHYKNLSGGEKAVFDLLLDLHLSAADSPETIYLIDEPEVHTNAAVQKVLLEEIVRIVPNQGQVWIASHSFGVLNAARKMWNRDQNSVVFLSFYDVDFDQRVNLIPSNPSKHLFEKITTDLLDDVAGLIAPENVIFCEGGNSKRNFRDGIDAICYQRIFGEAYPTTSFISVGSESQVIDGFGDRRNLLLSTTSGTKISSVVDRDDKTQGQVDALEAEGIRVLKRRELENYLWDPEVLRAFYLAEDRLEDFEKLQSVHSEFFERFNRSEGHRGEIKDCCGALHVTMKRQFRVQGIGSNYKEFMRDYLSCLVNEEMNVYNELKLCIFGDNPEGNPKPLAKMDWILSRRAPSMLPTNYL